MEKIKSRGELGFEADENARIKRGVQASTKWNSTLIFRFERDRFFVDETPCAKKTVDASN
jgi:hypothetical protein